MKLSKLKLQTSFSPSPSMTKQKLTPNKPSRNYSFIKTPPQEKRSSAFIPASSTPRKLFTKCNTPYSNEEVYCTSDHCPNALIVFKLQVKLQELKKENAKMKQINEFLLKTLSIKNDMISSMANSASKINEATPSTNTSFIIPSNKKKRNLLEIIQSAIENQSAKNKEKYLTNKLSIPFTRQEASNDRREKHQFNYLKFLAKSKPKKVNEHYDLLSNLVKKKTQRSNEFNSVFAILSKNTEALKALIESEAFIQMKKMTKIKADFINAIQLLPQSKLESLCEYIIKLVNEYKQLIHIVIRVKQFIAMALDLMTTNPSTIPMNYLRTSSTQILQCQRVNLYLYDQTLDALRLNPEDSLQSSERRFPIGDDIVGHTFSKREKQNIHDVTSDNRFDCELDKELGFDTKTMLCYPLLVSEANGKEKRCLGVIQAINKVDDYRLFNSDDEEMMSMLAKVSALTIRNCFSYGNYIKFLFQLRCLINYSIEMKHCSSSLRFIAVSEKVLGELGGVSKSQIVFVKERSELCMADNKDDRKKILFLRYNSKNSLTPLSYSGLLRKCHETKKMTITYSPNNSPIYDINVDIDWSFSILTFPIFDTIHGDIVAISQIATNLLFSKSTLSLSLHDNDSEVFTSFARIAGNTLSSINLF